MNDTIPTTVEECRQEPPSADYWFLRGQIHRLHPFIVDSFVPGDPVRSEFNFFEQNDDDDLTWRSKMIQALRTFDALPLVDRRRILNGWRPTEARPSVAEINDFQSGRNPTRCARLLGWKNEVVSEPIYLETDRVATVELYIAQGARKSEVLSTLAEMSRWLDANWNEMIDEQWGKC